MLNIKQHITLSNLQMVLLGVASISAAFFVGIKSSGEVKSVDQTMATETILQGDFDFDQELTVNDAVIALELAMGYRSPTSEELIADPNGDYDITVSDALTILKTIQ